MSTELSYASQAENAAPEPAPQSFLTRLTGVYFSPGETFKEIGRAPRVLVPMIVLMILGSVGGYLMIERIGVKNFFTKQFEQAVAKGQMSQEDADKQLEQMTSGPAGTVTKYSFPVIGLIQYPIIALILAGLCKLITMLMGGDNKFKAVFSVTLYALLAISIISTILFVAMLYLKPVDEIDMENLVGSNLAAVLAMIVGKDGLPKFVMALARWADLFGIWLIILLSIGYAAISGKAKASTYGWALGGIYLIFALGSAAWAAFR